MALPQDPRRRLTASVPRLRAGRSFLGGARAVGRNLAGRFGRCDRRRPRVVHLGSALGEFFGFALRMSGQDAPQPEGSSRRWSPSPLLYASAAVHLGAAAALLARPHAWPWALSAVVANHLGLAAAGLWPRSQLLGPNWIRCPG